MQTEVIDFTEVKQAVIKRFDSMRHQTLFYVDIDRYEIVEAYLSGFPKADRQEHNCGSCKAFLRQFGGLVTISESLQVRSIWEGLGFAVTDALASYVLSRPVTDRFYTDFVYCGTDKNFDVTKNVTWQHFHIKVPANVVIKKDQIATKKGQLRDDKSVLKRSLDELTLDASETVLELIGQNSLYRGKEFESMLAAFVLLQRRYKYTAPALRDNFAWVNADGAGVVSRIRNTALGTLLIDLSAGVDLDVAVTKFERVVAPTNYKRPTALTTPKMVEDAKAKIQELGLVDSLERRYATEADIRACDVLFKDVPQVLTDVFDAVSKDTVVNPRTFAKVEEISIEDFLANVVPTAKSISVLVENKHQNNFVSLLTAKDNGPSLFKWDNVFSWSYTGAVTDSIKERVKEAGGNVVGELRCSLSWFNYDDLDIHCKEPNGEHIYYGNKRSISSGGSLDVDMNAGYIQSRTPVENIIWANKNQMKEGMYAFSVHNYNKREAKDQGFVVQIECRGEVFDFEYKTNPGNRQYTDIVRFEYSKEHGIKFDGEQKSNIVSREKWGIKTNQFHKVTKLMLSPNHWDKPIGNKHYLFMLEDCKSDESPRAIFNEFLKQELDQHRKVFEVVGGKLKVEPTDNQLSGIGFSDTQKNSLIVKVTGKFTRTLKVNI